MMACVRRTGQGTTTHGPKHAGHHADAASEWPMRLDLRVPYCTCVLRLTCICTRCC